MAYSNDDSRDLSGKEGKGGMELTRLEMLLSDMDNEPDWRPMANKCADYYDHKQADAEKLARVRDTGEPLTITNLIQRTINGALGQEAKTRLNWKADADTEAFSDVAAVGNERLHEFQRETCSDMAISEAYSSMLRTGIGWVEVSKSTDPLAYPYRCVAVHRNEVWWDWRARLSDKSDAQWVIRQRWVDLDEAKEAMPQFADMLEVGCHTGPITDSMARTIMTTRDQFESIYATRRSFSRVEEEWLDQSVRKRVRFYSVYYKQPKTEVALALGTKRVKFNPQNPLHAALVQRGGAQLVKGPSFEIRHAMFAGPYRLFDKALKGRKFPLVPFICYSADDDRSPYGLVHGMIGPQDEFNERRSRLLWLLKAKQVFVDEDALAPKWNNLLDLAKEVMRPDAMFVLNENRRNPDGLKVVMNQQMQKEQADVMMDAKNLIQDVPGLYNALLGSGADGARSGVALNSLVEQSVTSLGETSDNYRTSRSVVGDLAMGLIFEDLMEPNLQVEVGTGKKRRVVILNGTSPEGLPVNPVEDASVKVALGDVPTTPAYRAQQQVFLSNAIQAVGNDPIARAVLVPALLESGDLEHRHEYAKWMRQQAGIPEPEDMDDESMAKAQEQKAQQSQAEGQAMQAQMAAELDKLRATVAELISRAELNAAKAQQIQQTPPPMPQAPPAPPMPDPQEQAAMDEEQRIAEALMEARQPA
jgi:hypothetical protein